MITVITYGIWLYKTDSEQAGIHNDEHFEISLLDAYKIGLSKANHWDPKAKLYLISSVDSDFGPEQGIDGKRRYWNMIFAVPGSPKSIIYTLHDREIINTIPTTDMTSINEVIDSIDAIKFDSSALIQKVQSDLMPAKGWATGYHFILSRGIDFDLIEVVGADKEGLLKKLYFNGQTGESINPTSLQVMK
ncbi:hypothetical protein [Paenibacillus daejeonensis]|uniref:hypothetical protein n=1 Tax=Paenibacillus daejeonensis TaxID=135193 RepID=UPI0012F93C82|nr:hypothetical protein [Paenibacillus daejeonensis]